MNTAQRETGLKLGPERARPLGVPEGDVADRREHGLDRVDEPLVEQAGGEDIRVLGKPLPSQVHVVDATLVEPGVSADIDVARVVGEQEGRDLAETGPGKRIAV